MIEHLSFHYYFYSTTTTTYTITFDAAYTTGVFHRNCKLMFQSIFSAIQFDFTKFAAEINSEFDIYVQIVWMLFIIVYYV